MFEVEINSIDFIKWEKFVKSINHNDKIGICYHADNDGLAGALYTYLTLKASFSSLQFDFFWIGNDEFDFASIMNWTTQKQFNKCIFVDISIENDHETVKFLLNTVKDAILIFDHHLIVGEAPSHERLFLINPTPNKLSEDERPIPTFLFGLGLAKIHHHPFPNWLLILSIFSEGLDDHFRNEIFQLFKCESIECPTSMTPREVFRNSIFSAIALLTKAEFESGSKTQISLNSILRAVEENKNADFLVDLLKPKLQGIAEEISSAISSTVDIWLAQIRLLGLNDNKIITIPIISKASIIGPVSSIIRGYHPNKIIATFAIKSDRVFIEFRTGNSNKVNIPNSITSIKGKYTDLEIVNYGGHPTAAGMSIKLSSFEKFMICFFEYYSNINIEDGK